MKNKLKKSKAKKSFKLIKFKKKDISNLRYAMIHSQLGFYDGVSIVMKQIEKVMINELNIPEKNLFYLVGRSKYRSPQIEEAPILWLKAKTNQLMLKNFNIGYGGYKSEKIEIAITKAKRLIKEFIKKHKIDVIIAHNTAHPENFIMSVALHRYYRDSIIKKERTPKYILWWHDSHLERKKFLQPANDVGQYLIHGVPGRNVEYIIFINNLQFREAEKYFLTLNKIKPGFYDAVHTNHDVIYNTTDTFIDSYDDLVSDKYSDRVEKFIQDFKIRELLKEHNLTLSEVAFCLQHTRIIDRKKIDFALEYCFELLKQIMKREKHIKALYFLISGHSVDKTKRKIISLHKKLSKKYKVNNFFLLFAEDFNDKTEINFGEYPRIIAKLRGFATYFSEIEGFGNNLLEVLASGLIPVVYTYPAFISDIAKYKFKLIALEKFEINQEAIDTTIDVLGHDRKRKIWVNRNLNILRKRFPHRIISLKLKRAIIRNRIHI